MPTFSDPRVRQTIRFILAAVFLGSGFLKILDTRGFIASLAFDYRLPGPLVLLAGPLPIFEFGLGLALLLFSPSRRIYATVFALFVAFSLSIVYGWSQGELEACHCFGAGLQTSPLTALARNFVLCSFAVVAWRHTPVVDARAFDWRRFIFTAAFSIACASMAFGLHRPFVDIDPRPGQVLELESKVNPPTAATRVLFVFDPTCSDCWNNVPRARSYARAGIDTVAVTRESASEDDLQTFVEQTRPEFPISRVSDTEFARLARREVPVMYVVHDGRITAKFEGNAIPSYPSYRRDRGALSEAAATPPTP